MDLLKVLFDILFIKCNVVIKVCKYSNGYLFVNIE